MLIGLHWVFFWLKVKIGHLYELTFIYLGSFESRASNKV